MEVPSLSPGRRLMARMPSTTLGNTVTLSRSSMVNTVSRCMWARSRVIIAAMTRSAAPLANSSLASSSTIQASVRSPTPTSTTPLPRAITSPPSMDARPKSAGSLPSSPKRGYQKSKPPPANIGW